MFHADLHIHSKYSRATSKDLDLEHLSVWARKKGIQVLGTGDFTHPAWMTEIKEKLVPAEPGLFKLRDDIERELERQFQLPPGDSTRFLLEVEISTIYKKGEKTRKVHHLIYAPDLEKADRIVDQLARIGNLKSDGRPILGLDSRNLLEITLNGGEGCHLIPAHIWTPWFSAMGSKSGFDAIEECYGDLSEHIFAVETGLSSDPEMNRLVSSLDRFALVSNSDAHSPGKVGREASVFHTEMSYHAMMESLQTKQGFGGTVEFFPEEGKYHMDGCRNCGVRLSPLETEACGAVCPGCGKPVTVGVMNRVSELADRDESVSLPSDPEFSSFVPLPEVLSEVEGVGPASKKVKRAYEDVLGAMGSEMFILGEAPLDELGKTCSPLLAEGLRRMRKGEVIREAGYDGEYGVIRLFTKEELKSERSTGLLFNLPFQEKPAPSSKTPATQESILPTPPKRRKDQDAQSADGILGQLDVEQRTAAAHFNGPLLIVAGPGAGKTRTVTHRIAHLIADQSVPPEQCLAITFTNRAAAEMRERLIRLLPDQAAIVPVMTFHALGLTLLREQAELAGLPTPFRVIDEATQIDLLKTVLSCTEAKAKKWLKKVPQLGRSATVPEPGSEDAEVLQTYRHAMHERGWVDFDDLIRLPVVLLEENASLVEGYRDRFRWISVDEFQDVDEWQYRLLQLLCPPDGNLCAIGDPDQAIYGFRGSDVRFFRQFEDDYPQITKVYLSRNYRSTTAIVDASMQAISPTTLEKGRTLQAVHEGHQHVEIHECQTERAEAERVVHSIESMIGGSSLFSLDSKRVHHDENRSLSFVDFAVLYRTDSQADALLEAFERSGIPFQKRAHDPLAEHPIARSIIEELESGDDTASLPERLIQAGERLTAEGTPEFEVRSIVRLLQSCVVDGGDQLADFQSRLALMSQTDLWDPRAERVSLLTLHASKGLEFPVVLMVGCEQGIMPLTWGAGDDTDVAEERRLFFVGMTRAKDLLQLSHAKTRIQHGERKERRRSQFLDPIEEALLLNRRHEVKRTKPQGQQLDLFGV